MVYITHLLIVLIQTHFNNRCSLLPMPHTFFLLHARWTCGSTADRSKYSSGLENTKGKTSSYSHVAGCSYCFRPPQVWSQTALTTHDRVVVTCISNTSCWNCFFTQMGVYVRCFFHFFYWRVNMSKLFICYKSVYTAHAKFSCPALFSVNSSAPFSVL